MSIQEKYLKNKWAYMSFMKLFRRAKKLKQLFLLILSTEIYSCLILTYKMVNVVMICSSYDSFQAKRIEDPVDLYIFCRLNQSFHCRVQVMVYYK